MSSPLTGTAPLIRLGLRRDRVRLPLWLLGLGGVITLSALAVPPLYDTPSKVAAYAGSVGVSPVNYLMSGRQAGLDGLGGIVANEISQVAQLGMCLMVVFLVVRHTRAEEESGRAELLRSTTLGRHAAAAAATAHAGAAALIVGAVTAAAMLSAGLSASGSVIYGAGLTLLGACYVGVALVAAQLASSARGALGLAGVAIAVGYLVRGVGAIRDDALVWASPFGWAQQMEPFGQERWWPALLLVAATAVLFGLTGWLTAHRDFGGGVLPARAGSPRASGSLGTPVGLAARLQRGLLLGWATGGLVLGLLYGAVVPTIPDLIDSNPDLARAIGADADAGAALTDAFLSYVLLFMAVLSTGFVVASVLRLRAEEHDGGGELVLTTTVSRTTWLSATVVVAGGGAVVIAVLMGLGLAAGYGAGTGSGGRTVELVAGQLSYVPAVAVLGALAVAVVGLAPRWASLAWGAVAFVGFQVLLGETLRLPDPLEALSPFWHLPNPPSDDLRPLPLAMEMMLAVVLVTLGAWGHRRRDQLVG